MIIFRSWSCPTLLDNTLLSTGCLNKIGMSDLTCVGWLLAMLTGHMIPFWKPWDLTSALGVILSFMIILRMPWKVYNVL